MIWLKGNEETIMTTVLKAPPPKAAVRSARKAKGDGHLRRGEILDAAERIFAADGYEATTIRRIAEEVGVSSTALYTHFPDKDAILLEISDRAIGTLLEASRIISRRPSDPVDRVRTLLEVYMTFGLENPNTYLLLFCTPLASLAAERQATIQALSERCFGMFATLMHEVAADGRLRAGAPKDAAQAIWAACHGLVALRIVNPGFDWSPAPAVQGVLLDGLLHGLVAD
jgi:AcrR family transcriptional regulator